MTYTEPLWTSDDIARSAAGRVSGRWCAEGVAIDSREVIPGDLFVALPGTDHDGHDFVARALAAGAAGALVERHPQGVAEEDPRLIHVQSTQEGLRALGAAARERMTGKVIAVTGSAGKTSVKDALKQALGRTAASHAGLRSFNNHVGLPLSLARMPRDARYGIFELGMNAPGEIAPLSELVRPDVAVITTVGAAHAGAFASEAEIAEEKAGIFAGLAPGGTAVLNIDHPYAELLKGRACEAGAKVVTVSFKDERADVRPLRLVLHEEVSCLTARLGEQVAAIKVGAPGRHWVLNALLVLAAVRAVGGDLALAGLALGDLRIPQGRGTRYWVPVPGGSVRLIDDAYNANPLSMAAAFESVRECRPEPGGRRIAVLADMAELGERTRQFHLDLAPALQAAAIAEVVALGEHCRAMADAAGIAATVCTDVADALERLRQVLRPGDVVLVKGANRSGLQGLAGALRGGEMVGRQSPLEIEAAE